MQPKIFTPYPKICRAMALAAIVIASCLVGGILLSSCKGISAAPSPTAIPVMETSLFPDITLEPAPVSFSIERMSNECNHLNSMISLHLVFYNITNKTVKIRNYFSPSIPNGSLIPIITDANGLEIHDWRQSMIIDTFFNPTPTPLYRELAPNSSFETTIDYSFPSLILAKTPGPNVVPDAGQYFVKFLYMSYGSSANDGIWNGSVESNQVELCIE